MTVSNEIRYYHGLDYEDSMKVFNFYKIHKNNKLHINKKVNKKRINYQSSIPKISIGGAYFRKYFLSENIDIFMNLMSFSYYLLSFNCRYIIRMSDHWSSCNIDSEQWKMGIIGSSYYNITNTPTIIQVNLPEINKEIDLIIGIHKIKGKENIKEIKKPLTITEKIIKLYK